MTRKCSGRKQFHQLECLLGTNVLFSEPAVFLLTPGSSVTRCSESQTESLLFSAGCSSPPVPWAGPSWAHLGFAKSVSIYALADSQVHLLCREGLEVTARWATLAAMATA